MGRFVTPQVHKQVRDKLNKAWSDIVDLRVSLKASDGNVHDLLQVEARLEGDVEDLQAMVASLNLLVKTCQEALAGTDHQSQQGVNFAFGHLSHYLLTGEVAIDAPGDQEGPSTMARCDHGKVECKKCEQSRCEECEACKCEMPF